MIISRLGCLFPSKKNVENIMIPSEEEEILMYPMDFEEFLWAIGNDTMMPLICHNFEKLHEVGQSMHRKCMDLFRQYLTVGGECHRQWQNTAISLPLPMCFTQPIW